MASGRPPPATPGRPCRGGWADHGADSPRPVVPSGPGSVEEVEIADVSGWSPLLALVPLLPVLLLAGAGLDRHRRQRRRARRALFLADLERDTITALYPTSAVGTGRAIIGERYRQAQDAAPLADRTGRAAARRARGAPAGGRVWGRGAAAPPGAHRAPPRPR